MNKKKVILKSVITIALIFVLICFGYNLSFFINLYQSDLKAVVNSDGVTKSMVWSWYDSYIIISIVGIVLVGLVTMFFVYLLSNEIIYCVKVNNEKNRTEKQAQKKSKLEKKLEELEK